MIKISRLNESLLEMVYFFPMKAEFEYILGKKENAIYKPSQQKETWLGFDPRGLMKRLVKMSFMTFYLKKRKHQGS